tara:strand:+ start:1767 stop:2009 length:243 start_codon:yes stop_codon:yes gene_type:complete
MSARDQNLRPLDDHDFASAMNAQSKTNIDSTAYYMVLADRLEKLLLDMQQSGTRSDDPLILRLADLLSETRALLRHDNKG